METQSQEHSLQLSAAEQAALQVQWQELAASFGADAQIVQTVWRALLNNYAAVTRHYHNLSHLKALLDWVELFQAHLQQPAAVRFAVWFHDVVYETRRQNNEERSAAFAQRELSRLQAPAALSAAVSAIILATKQHQAETLPAEVEEDGRWFLDFDLAILGSRPEIYRATARRFAASMPGRRACFIAGAAARCWKVFCNAKGFSLPKRCGHVWKRRRARIWQKSWLHFDKS